MPHARMARLPSRAASSMLFAIAMSELPGAHGPSRAASSMLPACERSERADNKLDNVREAIIQPFCFCPRSFASKNIASKGASNYMLRATGHECMVREANERTLTTNWIN